jgi:hypothetical protein
LLSVAAGGCNLGSSLERFAHPDPAAHPAAETLTLEETLPPSSTTAQPFDLQEVSTGR